MNQSNTRKIILLCIAGSALEWYDFAVFTSLAALISQIFFPAENKLLSLFATFLIFASGFLIRPIGAIFLGNYGDKHGRKKSLALSISLMTIATIGIGLIPSYQSFGLFAPCLLLALRLLQGFSVGAEYSGAITYLIESSHEARKTFNTSLSLMGTVIGVVMGGLVCALISVNLSEQDMLSFGWRIPFLLSFPLGYLGYYLRMKALETPEFLQALEKNQILRHPFFELLKHKKKELILTFFLFAPYNLIVYLMIVYFPTHLYREQVMSLTQMLYTNTFNLTVQCCLVPCLGWLGGKVGEVKQIKLGFTLLLIFAFPLFYLASRNTWEAFFVAQLGVLVAAAISGSVIPAFVASIYPTEMRFSGVSTGLNLSASLFGGTAPLVGLIFERLPYGFIWLSMYFVGITALSLWQMRRLRKH